MRRDSDDSTSTEGGGSTGDSTRELKVCELFWEKRLFFFQYIKLVDIMGVLV